MGNKCSCCPVFLDPRDEQDSIEKQSNLAVDGELETTPRKKMLGKKVNTNIDFQLQRQESRFFQTNPAVQNLLQKQQLPLMSSSRKQLEHHTSYYSRIKQTIKPNIQKISTTDDDDHVGEYYITSTFSENEDNHAQELPSKFQEKKVNLTFSHPPPPVLLEEQYRTVNEQPGKQEKTLRTKQRMEEIQALTKSQTTEKDDLYSYYIDLAMAKLENNEVSSSEQYVQKLLTLIKDFPSKDPFKAYILAGSIHLLKGNLPDALSYLLKALRLEISERGTESIRLVEAYYWLGEVYLRLEKVNLAKDYLKKSFRLYNNFKLDEPKLYLTLCLQLGKVNYNQEEYAQADRYFEKAAQEAQSEDDISTYIQILLHSAENQFGMDNYKQSLNKYSKLFKLLKLYQGQKHPFYAEALQSLSKIIKNISNCNVSSSELKTIVHIVEQISPDMFELDAVKLHLMNHQES